MKEESTIAYYKSILPQRINVQVVKDEAGVWAHILDLPHCYTQTGSIEELPGMLTDLVFTHYEIPKEFQSELGEYLPLSDDHIKWEDAFRKLVDIETRTQAGEEVNQIFARAVLA